MTTSTATPTKRPPLAVVILAAGQGTRMKSSKPKVLHEIAGRTMLAHVLATASELHAARTVVVVGKAMAEVANAAKGAAIAVQDPPQGTGHALMAAMPALEGFSGNILVLYADTPIIRVETLSALLGTLDAHNTACAVLGFTPADPARYGRLIRRDKDGSLDRIVEFNDASSAEKAVSLCNSGVMALTSDAARAFLPLVKNTNAKHEFYLTDLVAIANTHGKRCEVIVAHEDEVLGVNSKVELAAAERAFQQRLRKSFMDEGVTLTDPETVWFAFDTKIGRDVAIGQNVVFGPGVTVEDGVTIKPFCHIEGGTLRARAIVGPFARIRPGSDIGEDAHIGNFVETKKAKVGKGAKINHLSYVGDAQVGDAANIGAGTITCNYDGFDKHETKIGARAFIGSNTSLVAPVSVGDGAITGAGSVITRDVPADALAVERSNQRDLDGWAAKFRAKKLAAKKKD
ncbi:MAG TPA: bifunctional UDP-N-acetylglucosamine diphosphorylase/glucosamine-1-phosphate N-acetyltransferase GlmU [Micropepsaceae bacterium]|nr:bifunctional UDP-N-acetylglucosamine diphosphorylase/glucosamine-1-phosphate N-acetyltransferase GlmU [Micropepsaceae bacterium]